MSSHMAGYRDVATGSIAMITSPVVAASKVE